VSTIAADNTLRRRTPLFFPVMTTLLWALSIGAFSDNLFTDVGQPSNRDPKMVVHGLFGLAWASLFATQAWLVNVRRVSLHRRMGQATFLVAIGLTVTTLYLFYDGFRGWAAMVPETLANRLLLPVFVVCVALAYVRRTRPDWHKRLLLIGTMALLEPVLARLYDPLFAWAIPVGIDKALDQALFLTYLFSTWALLVGSMWLHDRATIHRIHPVTLAGSGAILLANGIAYLR
jgi:hypothetical protein